MCDVFCIQAKTLTLPVVVDLYLELFAVAGNGKIGTKKLEAALAAEEKASTIYPGSPDHPANWIVDCGPWVPYKGRLFINIVSVS